MTIYGEFVISFDAAIVSPNVLANAELSEMLQSLSKWRILFPAKPLEGPTALCKFFGTLALAFVLSTAPVRAQLNQANPNQPGQFDFYVFSLLWVPSLCQGPVEYVQRQQECNKRLPSFMVEGLWPQYEKGFPEFCQNKAPLLDRKTVGGIVDLIQDPNLATYAWERHGTCTGLSPSDFFATVRKASTMIKIPDTFSQPANSQSLTTTDLKEAFVAANDGLTPAAIVLSCNKASLREVRMCLTKDLGFRSCPEAMRPSCDDNNIILLGSSSGPGQAQ